MLTLALSVTGATYDAAKYIPAPDVMSTGLSPCTTLQDRVGWVVWTAAISGGLDVRPATQEEIAVEVERLRATDLKHRRATDPDAVAVDFATAMEQAPVYSAHFWADTPPFVTSKGGAIGDIALT